MSKKVIFNFSYQSEIVKKLKAKSEDSDLTLINVRMDDT